MQQQGRLGSGGAGAGSDGSSLPQCAATSSCSTLFQRVAALHFWAGCTSTPARALHVGSLRLAQPTDTLPPALRFSSPCRTLGSSLSSASTSTTRRTTTSGCWYLADQLVGWLGWPYSRHAGGQADGGWSGSPTCSFLSFHVCSTIVMAASFRNADEIRALAG